MGQRQDKSDIEYGNDCLYCWEAGSTPKSVYVRLSEVEKCSDAWCDSLPSPPNNHVFRLEQSPIDSCLFCYFGTSWNVRYHAIHSYYEACRLWVWHVPWTSHYFYSATELGVNCAAFFYNQNICVNPHCGLGGYGIVTDKLESIDLLSALNIELAGDLFMEMVPLDDGSRVYKYCKLKDGTNIKIKLEP